MPIIPSKLALDHFTSRKAFRHHVDPPSRANRNPMAEGLIVAAKLTGFPNLEDFSSVICRGRNTGRVDVWRREWDSNPRGP